MFTYWLTSENEKGNWPLMPIEGNAYKECRQQFTMRMNEYSLSLSI
jgi:hypothetical protein